MLRNQELKIKLTLAAGEYTRYARYKGNIFIQTDLLRRWITAWLRGTGCTIIAAIPARSYCQANAIA